jgi:ABC-2 type transport system ATP-binding protein
VSDYPLPAIEVSGISKSFRIPDHRYETLKQRALHPLRGTSHRELRVLREISFQVPRGEFLGVVGRNGSGKSTLLKLLASVYRPDSGGIRVAGTIAPIIELGVGFQPELAAEDNVVLNGLMLGLTPKEARRRFNAVLEFAELQEFADMKLKNYSSGMRVRLAFAIAMQTDPDVLLLDEVLAVGDAAFQQRCQEAFERIKSTRKKTVLLVTHGMSNIERHCDRAMLLEEGRIERIGDPVDVAERYLELSPSASLGVHPAPAPDWDQIPGRIDLRIRLLDSRGREVRKLPPGRPLRLHISVGASAELQSPRLLLRIANPAGASIFEPAPIDLSDHVARLSKGERVGVGARVENRLQPGRYVVGCVLAAESTGPESALSEPAYVEFVVGPDGRADSGLVSLDYEVRIRREARRAS